MYDDWTKFFIISQKYEKYSKLEILHYATIRKRAEKSIENTHNINIYIMQNINYNN